MCTIIFCMNLLYLINTVHKKKKISKYNVFCIIIALASLIFILTCPGNDIRLNSEIKNWYPEFSKYGLLEKLYLGIVPTLNIFISNKIVLIIFISILSYSTYIYSKRNFDKMLSIIIFSITLMITCLKEILLNMFPNINYLFNTLEYQGISSENTRLNISLFIFGVLFIISIVYMLFVIFKKKKLLPIFIFIAGVCSRLIIGFSPTVFASANRTAIFLYMAIIISILFILEKLYNDKIINQKKEIFIISILFVFTIFYYLNIYIRI